MLVKGHTLHASALTEPWLNILAVIIGIILFFYVCAARVQGDAPSNSRINDTSIKATQMKSVSRPSHLDSQLWRGDISDISNEKAGNSSERKAKRMSSPTFLFGTPSPTALPPSFVGP
jgi:hypothetical protein